MSENGAETMTFREAVRLALREELQRARPAPVKGRYFKSVALTTTMGPSIKVDPTVERD